MAHQVGAKAVKSRRTRSLRSVKLVSFVPSALSHPSRLKVPALLDRGRIVGQKHQSEVQSVCRETRDGRKSAMSLLPPVNAKV